MSHLCLWPAGREQGRVGQSWTARWDRAGLQVGQTHSSKWDRAGLPGTELEYQVGHSWTAGGTDPEHQVGQSWTARWSTDGAPGGKQLECQVGQTQSTRRDRTGVLADVCVPRQGNEKDDGQHRGMGGREKLRESGDRDRQKTEDSHLWSRVSN